MEMVGLVTMVTEVLTILSASANNIPVVVAISSFGTGLTAEKYGEKLFYLILYVPQTIFQ